MIIGITEAVRLLRQSDDIMIITHKRPDGDTLGSGVALCRTLCGLGKRCFVANSDEIPPKLRFLTGGAERLEVEFEPKFVVAVDIAELSLVGDGLLRYGQRADLCIDHHKSNRDFASATLLDAEAASVCELMYDVIGLLGVPIDIQTATALYVGLSTDTGCFKYRNNTPKSMRIAAEMMDAGVDYAELNRLLFETVTRGRIELMREMFVNMKLFEGGRLVISRIGKNDYPEDDFEGLTSIIKQVDGVIAAALMREISDGEYKLSLRANRGFDCSVVCEGFEGGGHEGAAGGTVFGSADECGARVESAMTAELRRNG